jgi:hypothetical protein
MRADVQFRLCAGEAYTLDFSAILGKQYESSFVSYPAQFTPYYNELGDIAGFTAYSAIAFPLQGNYDFTWGGDSYTFNVEFVECTELISVCCDNQVNVKWVNQQGGIQNWIFTGIKTNEVTVGDAVSYMGLANRTAGGFDTIVRAERYSSKGRCFRSYIVTSDHIRKTDIDALRSLRLSIQAWVVDDDGTDVPIVIEPEDFTEYTTRTKLYSIKIRFRTAIPIAIQ